MLRISPPPGLAGRSPCLLLLQISQGPIHHRVAAGQVPACVEACPTQARVFGELGKRASPLVRFLRLKRISVLKPSLNTEPKVYYASLDMQVR